MTVPDENPAEEFERRIDELLFMYVAVAKDRSMLRTERWRELQRLTSRILWRDGQLERARCRYPDGSEDDVSRALDVVADAAAVPAYEETGA